MSLASERNRHVNTSALHDNFKHLRHTFNTRLMEAGVIQDARMSLMGHSRGRPRTTNDIYTHIELPMLRQAIQKQEQWPLEQTAEIEKRKEEEQPRVQQNIAAQTTMKVQP